MCFPLRRFKQVNAPRHGWEGETERSQGVHKAVEGFPPVQFERFQVLRRSLNPPAPCSTEFSNSAWRRG